MKVTLYTSGCPMCKVLKSKLDKKGIDYEVVDDIETMKAMGFMSVPKLDVDGTIYDFKEAVNWIGGQ